MRDALAAVAAAEARLDATVAELTDEQAAAPSLLPGWTRAVLVTHIARNADSNARMVGAALRGESRAQYPGGRPQRAADIQAGRGRSAADVVADLRAAAEEWRSTMAAVSADQWELQVDAMVGRRTIRDRVEGRLVEVEVHHHDLGLGYSWRDWPATLAPAHLAGAVARLPTGWRVTTGEPATLTGALDDGPETVVQGAATALFAWLTGRADLVDAELDVQGDDRVRELPLRHPWG